MFLYISWCSSSKTRFCDLSSFHPSLRQIPFPFSNSFPLVFLLWVWKYFPSNFSTRYPVTRIEVWINLNRQVLLFGFWWCLHNSSVCKYQAKPLIKDLKLCSQTWYSSSTKFLSFSTFSQATNPLADSNSTNKSMTIPHAETVFLTCKNSLFFHFFRATFLTKKFYQSFLILQICILVVSWNEFSLVLLKGLWWLDLLLVDLICCYHLVYCSALWKLPR